MIDTKICGITSIEDAGMAIDLGAAAIGMIFYPQSPRYVSLSTATAIARSVDGRAARVGVFVNETPQQIMQTAKEVGLDWIQLSGNESPTDYAVCGLKIINVHHIARDNAPMSGREQDGANAILFDTHIPGRYGGTGETFDWEDAPTIEFDLPVILSGGLNPGNIARGIAQLSPDAVDISSGVESAAGKKDPHKMRLLFSILDQIDHKKGGLFVT